MRSTEVLRPEAQLAALGLRLPMRPPTPIGTFANVRELEGVLYVSGQGPLTEEGTFKTGKVGAEVDVPRARADARLAALNLLAAVKAHTGSLDRIGGVVKLVGLVNATPEFSEHPSVIDAASALMIEVFGEDGVHARTSFGVGSLPNQITVEIEAVMALRPS